MHIRQCWQSARMSVQADKIQSPLLLALFSSAHILNGPLSCLDQARCMFHAPFFAHYCESRTNEFCSAPLAEWFTGQLPCLYNSDQDSNPKPLFAGFASPESPSVRKTDVPKCKVACALLTHISYVSSFAHHCLDIRDASFLLSPLAD